MLLTLIAYFALLFIVSRLVGNGSNEAFFRGNRKSPWPIVAFGMIGASLSGVTFVSVPGMVLDNDMTYLQMCIGFFFGYLVISFVLLPLYYRYGLTSIYEWLEVRFGRHSHKTGATFFVLSKLMGAGVRMYVVAVILHKYVLCKYGFTYEMAVILILLLIWLYTRKSGIRTLIWTDSFQTLCLVIALTIIILKATNMLGMNISQTVQTVWNDTHSRIFEFDDITSKQHFAKQFISGIFITIVMTGLDLGLMQKNLTCKNLRSAQKDMCSYGIMFIPVNLMFLSLGVLMIMLYHQNGIQLPVDGDSLMTEFVAEGYMGTFAMILFTIGIIAPAFSSADSAITAVTTSICIDILKLESKNKNSLFYCSSKKAEEKLRKFVHASVIAAFAILVIVFKYIGNGSAIDTIYTVAGYTYGPLLGLFAFGILTKHTPSDKHTPYIAALSPLICYSIYRISLTLFNYEFGYEILLFNGLLTFTALFISSRLTMHKHFANQI